MAGTAALLLLPVLALAAPEVLYINAGRGGSNADNPTAQRHSGKNNANGHNWQLHNSEEYPLTKPNEDIPDIGKAAQQQPDSPDSLNPTMTPPSVQCGAEVDGTLIQNGTISSPGYPDNYPAFLNCVWRIKAMPGKKILATFSEFDVTASTECGSDYVTVTTGDLAAGGSSIRYCGKSPPAYIESLGEVLVIEFHTNQGDSCRGFALDYTIVTKEVTCGSKTSDAQFEFLSPLYPAMLPNKTAQCDLTISHDCENPICQLRLDFLDLRLGPPTGGDCNGDQFIVRANEPLPVLCGNNSGQHIYVDVRGRSETNLNLLTMPVFPKPVGVHNESDGSRTIVSWLHEVDPHRGWKILVTQLPCDCSDSSLPDRYCTALHIMSITVLNSCAPTGCLQYHTGITGTVSSFNFHGTIMNYEPCYFGNETTCGAPVWTGHLNSLDYSTCIKSAPGYCGIAFQQPDSSSFQLSGLDTGNIPFPLNGEASCSEDYVFIPRGQHPSDMTGQYTEERYCGQVIGNKLAGPVLSYAKPFLLMTRTDGVEAHSGVALNNRGYSLNYQQIPCSVDRASATAFT
jgi:hypothetical protein